MIIIKKGLTRVIHHIWNEKIGVIPVIIGDWNHFKIIQKINEHCTRKS
jgi:hypothetical protein